ncbi:MAG TPA: glucuronide uptake porin UidC [Pseudomonas sp.]|nr:glucuronide uptake porin UidC [Pseudomonas sp.]
MHLRQNFSLPCMVVILSCFACQAIASDFYEQDDTLRLRLRNELRRADKPSAGAASDIYAWVQGAALEYNSPYAGDIVGVDVGGFYTQRLDSRDNWSTRWYLDGDDSFGRYTAAVKVKLSDTLKLKAGRMVTDSTYSGQDDIPIINTSSQRTQPSISDGVLLKYSPRYNLDIYGMYRVGVYTYPDVSLGVHKAGPINPNTLKYDNMLPQYITSVVYHNQLDTYAVSTSWQKDVAAQVMTRASQRYPVDTTGENYIKPEWMAFYGKLNGVSTKYDGPVSTYVLSGQLNYVFKQGSVFVAAGKVGPKLNRLGGVDTDLGYAFDLSIDRNHSDMWSAQLGRTWNLPYDTFIGVAEIFTNGYEDYHQKVKVTGVATDVYLGYMPKSGYLKGLRSLLILNSAREEREGSALGNHLDYFDIKLTVQYDFTLR